MRWLYASSQLVHNGLFNGATSSAEIVRVMKWATIVNG
jgi:hypothetical protein